jgi:hypothetical protein
MEELGKPRLPISLQHGEKKCQQQQKQQYKQNLDVPGG